MAQIDAQEKIRVNLAIRGKRTSLALETDVWDTLTEICRREEKSLDELCETIVAEAGDGVSMASAIRMTALAYFRKLCDEPEPHTGKPAG